jgi:secreted trypsin-like serine protease
MQAAAGLLLASIASLGCGCAVAGDGATWMRDYVRQRQALMLQRALGNRAGESGISTEIIGGRIAKPGRWPFQVGLLDAAVANNFNAQYCGGTLIDSRHVLTAAHCVDFLKKPSKLQILTGTQSLATGGTRRDVAAFKFHPQWNPRTSDYDVAVVTLKQAVAGIPPVAVIARAQEEPLAAPDTEAFVVGWGDIKEGTGTQYPTDLYEVQVPLVRRGICNGPESYDGDITARMLCAGLKDGGKDSCQGDSGGPLIVMDSTGRYRLQAGIVSWGNGCAEPNFYGVYSRLAVLSSWVHAIVAGGSGPTEADACDGVPLSARSRCYDAAIGSVQAEQRGYLDRIARDGSPEQAAAAQSAQRAWSASLATLCAFAASNGGEIGRKGCVLGELRKRADTLAQNLAELGQ